jgi:hypothetical protein
LGDLDIEAGKRRSRPVFDVAIEIRAKGKFMLHESVGMAVDTLLTSVQPEGIKIGNW